MKKKYAIVAALTALVVLVSAAIPALAEDTTGATDVEADIVPGPALGIDAPQVAGIDEEITITVFDRQTSEPAEGAGVWLVSWEKAGELRADVATLAAATNYESKIGVHGEFLGLTGGNGQVQHTFREPGFYLLVAVKDGHSPGFTLIRARQLVKTLGIRAPRVAPVGEEVAITVFDRQTKEPVEGAGVWLVSKEKAEELKAEIAALRADGAAEQDYESVVSLHGKFLGLTGVNGQVWWTPEEAGIYLLVAVKGGYIPGFTLIRAGQVVKALGIRAPRVAPVGEEVTITVFDRQASEPAEGAGVWLISREKAEELKAEIAALRKEDSISASEQDYESIISLHGKFLGLTGVNGQVWWTPEEAGIYLLVAVKDGYIPGFALIRAGSEPTTDSARVRNSAGDLASLNSLRSVFRVRSAKSMHSMQPMSIKARAHNGWANTDIITQ